MINGLRVFPVRHHSPLAARHVARVIRDDPPAVVLIEGPADASGFIKDLVAAGTRPPVSLLYFLRGRAFSSLPYAEFSPEYQAMRVADELGIVTRFCDMPYRLAPGGVEEEEPPPPPAEPADQSAIDRGSLDFYWEAEFELRERDLDSYMEGALALGRQMRGAPSVRNRSREAYMYATIQNLVASGTDPKSILVVCGAAHAPALLDGDVDLALLDDLKPLGEAEIYLVPYSFSRFSSVLGYGAGTCYPHFYQALWEAGGKVDDAVCRMLTEICRDLADSGYIASVADTIDALALARRLAELRGKAGPGPEEMVQAVESCLTRGHYGKAAVAVRKRLVGEQLGCVTAGADRSPLAREFYAYLADQRRAPLLPLTDVATRRTYDLRRELHREVSRFLHRLTIMGVPYADPDDEMVAVVRRIGGGYAPAGPGQATSPPTLRSLARAARKATEVWKLEWYSSLDACLADLSATAHTIGEAASRKAEALLAQVKDLEESTALFIEVDRAGLERNVLPCLQRVEELARTTDDLPLLAQAAADLAAAVRYGAGLSTPERAIALAELLVRRAAAVLDGKPRVPDERIDDVAAALDGLCELRDDVGRVARLALERSMRAMARDPSLQPALAGAACAVAFRHGLIAPLAIIAEVRDRVMDLSALMDAADYLEALLRHGRGALLASPQATDAVRELVLHLPEDRFVAVLPALRKGFSCATEGEVRYFMALLMGPASRRGAPVYSSVTRRLNASMERAVWPGLGRWL
jgi:hypothetical protein